MWQIITAMLVFFMQTGFAMLCSGFVRAKNTKNILLKNILDACVGAIGFWSIGCALGCCPRGRRFVRCVVHRHVASPRVAIGREA